MKALTIVVYGVMGKVKVFVHADTDADADAGGTTIALRTFVPAS